MDIYRGKQCFGVVVCDELVPLLDWNFLIVDTKYTYYCAVTLRFIASLTLIHLDFIAPLGSHILLLSMAQVPYQCLFFCLYQIHDHLGDIT